MINELRVVEVCNVHTAHELRVVEVCNVHTARPMENNFLIIGKVSNIKTWNILCM